MVCSDCFSAWPLVILKAKVSTYSGDSFRQKVWELEIHPLTLITIEPSSRTPPLQQNRQHGPQPLWCASHWRCLFHCSSTIDTLVENCINLIRITFKTTTKCVLDSMQMSHFMQFLVLQALEVQSGYNLDIPPNGFWLAGWTRPKRQTVAFIFSCNSKK